MPNPVDHLKDKDRLSMKLALVYGEHIGVGHLVMSHNSGGSGSSYVNKIRHALCEGAISSVEGCWYDGTGIGNGANGSYVFYDGTQTTAPAEPFDLDQPHTGTAMIDVTLPAGLGPSDNVTEEPAELVVRVKGLKVWDYDFNGSPMPPGQTYSTNPARVTADVAHTRGKEPLARTNWLRWTDWKNFFDVTENNDYSTLTGHPGIGLTAKFYEGTNFQTLKVTAIVESPYVETGTGAPIYGVPIDNFSVRYSGKIRAKTTGSCTFTAVHDNGVRLTIGSTMIIDSWQTDGQSPAGTHSASISLVAGQLYDFQLDWNEGGGPGYCKLTWTPFGETDQMIPKERLYPAGETLPRYELHALFEATQGLDEAVRHCLLLSNSIVQDADGKRNFYCLEELTTPTFAFNQSNIKLDTFTFRLRDRRDLANRFEAVFRHLKSQYLKPADPNAVYEIEALQADAGRVILGETLDLDSTTYWQARKVLKIYAKLQSESSFLCEFDGTAATYPVLPGDLVTITHPAAGWTNKTFLVLEAIDYSPETAPDRRHFVLLEWAL